MEVAVPYDDPGRPVRLYHSFAHACCAPSREFADRSGYAAAFLAAAYPCPCGPWHGGSNGRSQPASGYGHIRVDCNPRNWLTATHHRWLLRSAVLVA